MSLTPSRRSPVDFDGERGHADHVEVARDDAVDAVLDAAVVDRREEPDRAVVEREDRHVAPGEEAHRGEDRAVAAEHHREVGVAVRLGSEHHAVALRDAVLLDLVGRTRCTSSRLGGEPARRSCAPPRRCRRRAGG